MWSSSRFYSWTTSLFNLYKWSCHSLHFIFPILFADDTDLFNHDKDIFSLRVTLNQELASISKWLKVNKSSLHITKTMYMMFTRKKTRPADVKIEIDKETISETKSSKFLWVHIDNKLKWRMHVDYVSRKVARVIGILIRARKVFSIECMTNLYYAFIYPYLSYCNHIWGNTYKTTLSKLQILQNKAIRIITESPHRTNNETLYKQNCKLNLNKISTYFVGKFMCNVYSRLSNKRVDPLIFPVNENSRQPFYWITTLLLKNHENHDENVIFYR